MTIGYDIEVIGLDEQLSKLAQYDAISNKQLGMAMRQSVLTIQGAVTPLVPVFTARLKNSIGSEVTTVGNSLIGRVGSSLKDEVYPQVMEYGREPGSMPPVDALLRWVHLKIRPGEENEFQVALAIARKIKARGIKGKFFMKTGFENAKARVVDYFARALDRIAEGLSNGR